MSHSVMHDRNSAFQILKPSCVNLTQASLRLAGRDGSSNGVVKALEEVLMVLDKVACSSSVLDEKLAGYVFFPISQTFRVSHKLSVRGLELALRCLLILLGTGWKSNLPPEMGTQLLILLTHLASGSTASAGIKDTSEELRKLALDSLNALFTSLSYTKDGKNILLDDASIPALGHCISIVLDNSVDGPSQEIQTSAVMCLTNLCTVVKERDVLASFMPGLVSSLTKIVTPNTRERRSSRTLRAAIELMRLILQNVLSDEVTKDLPEKKASGQSKDLDRSWLQATAGQTRQALANVLRIRHHFKPEVRFSLADLCYTILTDCRQSLESCGNMMLETLVVLCSIDRDGQAEKWLVQLLLEDQRVKDLMKLNLYNWIISLPWSMQSQDSDSQTAVLRQIMVSLRLLAGTREDLSLLQSLVASSLRDGIVISMHKPKGRLIDGEENSLQRISELPLTADPDSVKFAPVLMNESNRDDQLQEISGLISILSSSNSFDSLARDLLRVVRTSSSEVQVANFWLVLNLIRSSFDYNRDFYDFIQVDSTSPDEMLYDLYSFSLEILSDSHTDESYDWRIQALALETISLLASRQKADFRGELIDALYPAIHLVGATNLSLRDHAMKSVNDVALYCEYVNTADMIVSNVDYLINAISLKLNTFDISPQAPMVLVMMIRLSGPSLLPFLDDLVETIFTALESFHGYPNLVELLFETLRAIAEEGAKLPQLALTDTTSKPLTKNICVVPQIGDVVESIKILRDNAETSQQEIPERINHPKKPWNPQRKTFDEAMKEKKWQERESDESDDKTGDSELEAPPPAPKIYTLLLNISVLTQHFLTSSSGSLRVALLSLLNTTIPALASHENSFLPFINTIWPVLTSRLEDPEAFVQSKTLDIISTLCAHGRDFLKSRLEELWPRIRRLHYSVSTDISIDKVDKPSVSTALTMQPATGYSSVNRSGNFMQVHQAYVGPQVLMIRESLVKLLKTIVEHVSIPEEIYQDILDLISPILMSDEDLKVSLENFNGDALWLKLRKSNFTRCNARFNDLSARYSRRAWKFAEA